MLLLTNEETMLDKEEEQRDVAHLLGAIGYSIILAFKCPPGTCETCLRYVLMHCLK